jgi:23S rRNA (guanosine2251-2'-O)-methyltransferase
MSADAIAGRNPVMEALKAGRPINKIYIAKNSRPGSFIEITKLAKSQGIIIQEVEPGKLDTLVPGVRHQGIVAMAAAKEYVELDELLADIAAKQETPLLVLLDELEDPHNFGAILRTCDAVGAHGVLIPKRRGVSLTSTVARTSAGAVEYMPVARIGNIGQTLEKLKKLGYWVVGADMDGERFYYESDLKGPLVVVLGNEGAGISRLVKEHCDFLVQIPMRGQVNSLNVSVAGSILLYEILRQREQTRP